MLILIYIIKKEKSVLMDVYITNHSFVVSGVFF